MGIAFSQTLDITQRADRACRVRSAQVWRLLQSSYFSGLQFKPVGHIGDEAGDLGHGIGLFESLVNDFHDFVIIPCEPVVAGIELIPSSHVT